MDRLDRLKNTVKNSTSFLTKPSSSQRLGSYETEESQQIDVALLCQDLKLAKKLSDVFTQIGVRPYICTKLSDFWGETLKETPHLALVDVKMMSQGDYLFKDHPKIVSEEMPVAFYYEKDSAPLLYSTYDILNLGIINTDQSLIGQLKAVLKRFNTFQSWQEKAQMALHSEEKLDDKLTHIVKRTEELKEKTFYQSFLKSLQGRFENERGSEDFQTAVARVFGTVKEFKSFTFLELSPSGQKLVSPKFQYDKYIEVPSLWLGRTCDKGIEFFAQNMASQICLELMGGELMSLMIKGRSDNPDMMIFIRVEGEEFLAGFDWESLERYLSGFYCYFNLRSTKEGTTSFSTGKTWDLYNFLDEIRYGALPEGRIEGGYERFSLIGINFNELVDRALQQKEMRFYWQKFYQDFLNGLEVQKGIVLRSFHYDVRNTFLLVEKEELEDTLIQVKNYCMRYPFWRYFEDADVVLGASLKPDVRIYPMAPEALERITQEYSQTAVAPSTFETEDDRALVGPAYFHPGSEQNM